ncbi:MAG: hypothetical protein DHS20C15_07700 [Planctomycetota bacterium]|nr:MAG: hypothetical protein DHS20C15_07700 [Planctomycetota bacterium]
MLRSTVLSLSCLMALAVLAGLPRPGLTPSSSEPAVSAVGLERGARDHDLARVPQAPKSGPDTPARVDRAASTSVAGSLDHALRGSARICKPGGPWGAHLQARSLGPGDRVSFDVVLKPLLPNAGLRWSLELPEGTQLLAGRNTGEIAGTPGLEVRETLSLRLPAGLDAGSVRLDVTPLDDTRLSSSRELDFGVAPVVGSSQLFVADTGATSALLVLPSTTREGR